MSKKSAEEILRGIDSKQMSRAEIRNMIRATSKKDFLDHELKRLGFWEGKKPKNDQKIDQLNEEIAELREEIRLKRVEFRDVQDAQKRLSESRKQRILESREQRKVNLEARERAREQKALEWKEKQKSDIVYLGEGTEHYLNLSDLSQYGKLDVIDRLGIPQIANTQELADVLEIDVPTLRKLCFTRKVSRFNAYIRFSIPKKTGGERIISAPNKVLKNCQHMILEKVLNQVDIDETAHGFVKGRSIRSNAEPHVGKRIVINMDMKDFFPTITFPRVAGLFVKMGYTPKIATMLALITTEPSITECTLDGEMWYLANGERFLPQGAPTSPAITNILCHRLDKRLRGLASSLNCSFTRYADDITFSYDDPQISEGRILATIKKIVEDEGLVIHPEKTKIMRNGGRKEVTGVVVNKKLSVRRKDLRRFRALLQQIEKNGPDGKYWNKDKYEKYKSSSTTTKEAKEGSGAAKASSSYDVLTEMMGFAAYVNMVDESKGSGLIDSVKALMRKYR